MTKGLREATKSKGGLEQQRKLLLARLRSAKSRLMKGETRMDFRAGGNAINATYDQLVAWENRVIRTQSMVEMDGLAAEVKGAIG